MSLRYAIAMTGGIGTGKSTAGSMFSLYGYSIIDADKISHQLLESNKSALVQLFSEAILDTQGTIDRKKLAKIIFHDKSSRKKLQDLLHPQIRQKILESSEELETHQKYYFLDIPLFFETGGRQNYNVNKTLLIYAPLEIQIARVMSRDSLSKEQALQRIQAQMDIEQKKHLSDWVIENTSNLKTLQKEVENFLNYLD